MKRFFTSFVFFALITCLFVVVIFFYKDIGRFLNEGKEFLSSLFSTQKTIRELIIENEGLKTKLEEANFSRIKEGRYSYKIARVYSHYPFNDAASIVIDLGSDDGIERGMPVMAEEGILFGIIKETRRTQSEVETIFSPEWKTSVSVGEKSVKAVLSGGPIPVVDLIPAEEDISVGDPVWNGAKNFPMRAHIGSVSEIHKNKNDVWKKASVKAPYKPELLDSVLVITNFP